MKEAYNKYSFLINLGLVILVVSAFIALMFYMAVRPKPTEESRYTGGPGEPSSQTVSIFGWDDVDQYGARLSRIMDIPSQKRVIKYVETDYLSRYKGQEKLINGHISDIESDNSGGTTTFRVKIADDKYQVSYNLNTKSVNVTRSEQ